MFAILYRRRFDVFMLILFITATVVIGVLLLRRNPDSGNRPLCPFQRYITAGRVPIQHASTVSEAEKELALTTIARGGFWHPQHCLSRWRLALVVPFRKRDDQLGSFLLHMHRFLQRQRLQYAIYIIEQDGEAFFNRGKLLNSGYKEAMRDGDWDCVVFHDVDLLPENDNNLYACAAQPQHLVVSASNNRYKPATSIVLKHYFGGASVLTPDQMKQVNGWSNLYWGWGGEDDDMTNRISYEGLEIWRLPANIGRYTSMKHGPSEKAEEDRHQLVNSLKGKYKAEGLSTVRYRVVRRARQSLFTHILVDIDDDTMPKSAKVT